MIRLDMAYIRRDSDRGARRGSFRDREGSMVREQALVRGLEMLTEGRRAQLPARLGVEGFRAEAESVRMRAQEWTHGAGIEGLIGGITMIVVALATRGPRPPETAA